MTDLPEYQPSKEELRASLSMHYVCAKLGIELNREAYGLCPFHADVEPSFYLWVGDDGQTRWWCQPCGHGGDIFDLIMRRDGCTFPGALERAAELLRELPPGYEPPTVELPVRHDPTDWADEVALARTRATLQDGILAMRMRYAPADDLRLCSAWDTYLRGTWGWGVSESGQIYMPHWAPDGTLTGCKKRDGAGRKDSMPGSRYTHLYGSWLGRRHRDVLITAGESDAAYAGWSAAADHLGIDVFGMPRGEKSNIDPAWLDFLRGASRIFLALDPDEAGVEGTRRWIEMLQGHTRDVRVCTLPLGRDLREARPDLRHLLSQARVPLHSPTDIAAEPGGYVRHDAEGNAREVTPWTVEPIAQLAGGDEPGFDAHLYFAGTKTRVIIRLADLATTHTLNRWCNVHNLIFTGTDKDRQRIAELVKARGHITPEIFQTERVGIHVPPQEYVFAGPSVVYPDGKYAGQLPWRYAPTRRTADVSGRVYLPDDEPFHWPWLESFLALSTPDVMHPLLSWIVAAARRHEAHEFPLLFLSGSSGVGKSTLARLAMRLATSKIEIDLGGSTPFILVRTLAASTSIPVFVDEWTRLSRDDIRQAFQGSVPVLYAGGLAERGQADLSAATYYLTAPVIVAGEDTFTLDREKDRVIMLRPTKQAQNLQALQAIALAPLERFGHGLHTWLATAPPDLPRLDLPEATRPEHNRQVLEAGWATLLAFLEDAAGHGEDVPVLPLAPDLSCFIIDPEDGATNVYEEALREGMALADPNHIPVVWPDQDGRGTWVRAQSLIGLIETRRLDIQLPGRSKAMLAYFKERYGDVTPHRTNPPGTLTSVRAHLIRGLDLREEENV